MNQDWYIFTKEGGDKEAMKKLKAPPPWRDFQNQKDTRKYRGEKYKPGKDEVKMVNAALYLRRPLLVTGDPGVGKSSLAYAVASHLDLDEVLYWPISTRSTLQDALYTYDAIGRLQDTRLAEEEPSQPGPTDTCAPPDIGRYITLGPLGTALLPREKPRVLLIDEIDKSDIDLPGDLLNVLEEGGFEIQELKRLSDKRPEVKVYPFDSREMVPVTDGKVRCTSFPFIVITSNRERELPAPFLRRCLRLDIKAPEKERLREIVESHFDSQDASQKALREKLITEFLNRVDNNKLLSTDQLLNAIFLASACNMDITESQTLLDAVLRDLKEQEAS